MVWMFVFFFFSVVYVVTIFPPMTASETGLKRERNSSKNELFLMFIRFVTLIMRKFANCVADAFCCRLCEMAPAHNIRWPV